MNTHRSPRRFASLLSRILGYTRHPRPKAPASTDADRWENEGGSVEGVPARIPVHPPSRRGQLPPRIASRRALSLLLFSATAFIVVLSMISGESASLTLLPATFMVLFVLTVASLRHS